jgi:hypothetical protein
MTLISGNQQAFNKQTNKKGAMITNQVMSNQTRSSMQHRPLKKEPNALELVNVEVLKTDRHVEETI